MWRTAAVSPECGLRLLTLRTRSPLAFTDSSAVRFISRGEFRFDGPRNRRYTGPINHLSRCESPRLNKSAGFFISARTTRQRTSRCQHEECGESSGSVTRTPNRRPVSQQGRRHGGPAGQANAWSHARSDGFGSAPRNTSKGQTDESHTPDPSRQRTTRRAGGSVRATARPGAGRPGRRLPQGHRAR